MPVLALVGRRIDAVDAPVARFPLSRVEAVRQSLDALFARVQPSSLVCSAACGADLLALEQASKHDVPAWIVLPFAPDRFRKVSVTDRPGDWGPLFDRMYAAAERGQRTRIVAPSYDDQAVYSATNTVILDLAKELASNAPGASSPSGNEGMLAVVVWDGRSRGSDDLTQHFLALAQSQGVPVEEVPTI